MGEDDLVSLPGSDLLACFSVHTMMFLISTASAIVYNDYSVPDTILST